MLRRCVWYRNIKNGCSIYIYDISRLRVKSFFDITFVLKQCVFFTIHVFWYMTPCRLANSLGGTCYPHLHCSWRRVDYPENGGTKIIRNACNNLFRLSNNTAALLQPRNLQCLLFLQNQGASFTPLQSNYEMFGFYSSSIPGHWGFFPGHQTVPCALGSTQPLKTSTRIFLGVKTAGA